MKKMLVALIALVMILASVSAVAEVPTDIYGVVDLAKSMITNDSTDFSMNVEYNEEADLVVFTTIMYTLDWEVLSAAMETPEFQSVGTSLLETTTALKDVVDVCGLSQDVLGLLVSSDGAIVAAYFNNVDVTPLVTGY